jgi:hypothetical protein
VIVYSSVALAEGGTLSPGDNKITVSSVSVPALASGDHVQIENEVILITGVTGTILTVSRGVASTTATAHVDGSAVRKVQMTQVSQVGGVIAADTSLTVVSVSNIGLTTVPPSVHIRVGAEVMLVSAIAGQTLTVARGRAGTLATVHANGETVTLVSQTLLNGAIDGSTTTVVVAAAADLPRLLAGVFLQVDDEIMEVTNVAGDTLTVSIPSFCLCVYVYGLYEAAASSL